MVNEACKFKDEIQNLFECKLQKFGYEKNETK